MIKSWWLYVLGLALIAGGGCYTGMLMFTFMFGAALAPIDIVIILIWFALFVIFIWKSYTAFFEE